MLDAIARNLVKTGRLMKHIDPAKEKKGEKKKAVKVEKINGVPFKKPVIMRSRKKKNGEN